MSTRLPSSTLFPYTTLFRSELRQWNIQFGTLSENDGPLNEVLQFANIAGPGIAGQGLHRPLGYGFDLLRSEEHTSELQSQFHLVCRLLLEKKKISFANFKVP